MTQPKQSGTVAARIQAFQAGWHTNHRPVSGPPPRRTLTLTYTNDGGIVVGRGRRRDPSFASPASRVLKDNAEGALRDSKPSAGLVPHVSHPAYEEKEVYFRPFSRASRQSPSDNDEADRDVSPQTVPQISSTSTLQESSSIEHHDGTNELRAARSRLRSIAERKESDGRQEDQQDLSMNDLGNLLDDAIGQHASNNLPTDGDNSPVDRECASLPKPDPMAESTRPLTSLRKDNSGINFATELPALQTDNNKMSIEANDTTQDSSSRQSTALTPLESVTPVPTVRPTETLGVLKRRGSIFQRYNSRAHNTTSDDSGKAKEAEPVTTRTANMAATTSPIKQRAALFDQPPATKQHTRHASALPSAEDVRHKATWSQYQASSPRKFSKPFRNMSHHRRTSSTTKPNSSLKPLTLPQIVKRDMSKERKGPRLKEAEAESISTKASPAQNFSNVPSDHNVNSGSPNVLESDKIDLKGELRDVEEPCGTLNNLDKPSTPVKKRPSKWDLLQRNKASNTQKQHEPEGVTRNPDRLSRSARSSIVESRIQDLIAASKQQDSKVGYSRRRTADGGRVEQTKIVGRIADHQPLNSKNLPELQMPISEQADAVNSTALTRLGSSGMAIEQNGPADKASSVTERSASPVKPQTYLPTTPIRGRSRKVKQSLSPRGIPYAIEQRFSLSPSRSRSRRGESGVFVSVEVRNSPERNHNGSDGHEVIVRASVEPDDIFEDSED